MTSTAELLHLEAWRDPDGVLHRAVRREVHPRGWPDLHHIGQTDKRDAVRIYERLGLHPILLHGIHPDGSCSCGDPHVGSERAIGKHPVYHSWQRLPLDVPHLDERLQRYPVCNVGLRMGRQPSGVQLVCIDVDGPRDLLAGLEAEHGPLPPTLTATSGRGLHLIYRMPAGRAAPRNRVRLAPGVDVRSEGGQIVAAPSRHYSGRTYRWLDAREPAELPP